MSHTRGEAQLAISVPRALDQHEDKQTSLFPKSSFLLGLVFVFGVAFGMIGLPTIITDWQQYCGKSCFPDKVRCNIHSSITVRPHVIASVLMESTKERMVVGMLYFSSSFTYHSRYKYIYFNMEKQTYIIFCVVAFYIIMAHRAVETLAKLLLSRRLSLYAFIAFSADVFPNFYSCYMHFNYINDNIHHLHAHQTYFSITELIAAFCIIKTADTSLYGDPGQNRYLWICFTISTTHMVQALKDNILA
jgi:hypothetical protein